MNPSMLGDQGHGGNIADKSDGHRYFTGCPALCELLDVLAGYPISRTEWDVLRRNWRIGNMAANSLLETFHMEV